MKGKPETQREQMRGVVRKNKNKRKINQARRERRVWGRKEESG